VFFQFIYLQQQQEPEHALGVRTEHDPPRNCPESIL
jgi:hypothetical protein